MTLLYMDPMITAYVTVLTAILGLCFGIFLNCWAWRSTHGMSIMRGHSICPECKHDLGLLDLIPVFSWLFSKGKCRHCGAPVPKRYPLTELLCAVIFVSIVLTHGLTLETAEFLLLACALFFLSLTDIDDYIIPNGAIIFALVVRFAYIVGGFFLISNGYLDYAGTGVVDVIWNYGQAGNPLGLPGLFVWTFVDGFIIAVPLLIITLVMDKVLGKESMGGGDLKLFFVVGCVFGWALSILIVIVACIVGLVFALVGPKRAATSVDSDDAAENQNSVALNNVREEDGASIPDNAEENDGSSIRQDVEHSEECATTSVDSTVEDGGTHDDIPARAFPFGPSIALACWLAMLVGPQIINWYFSLF